MPANPRTRTSASTSLAGPRSPTCTPPWWTCRVWRRPMAENPLAKLLGEYQDVGANAITFAGGSIEATEAGLGGLLGWVAGAGPWWSFREWSHRMSLDEGIAGGEGDAERL